MQVTLDRVIRLLFVSSLVIGILSSSAWAEVCQESADLEEATRTSIETTARRLYDMAARADVSGLQQNSILSVASSFAGIEAAVKDIQPKIAGAQSTLRPVWMLQASGTEPIAQAEFLCGVFGARGQTAKSTVFMIPNLPPGDYAITVFDVAAKIPHTVSFVLQQAAADWKLGGFYAKASQAAGHDGEWFANRAHEFKTKGQTRNAWLYFMQARELISPVPFMSTAATDKLYDEMQKVQPKDVPLSGGDPIDISVAGKTYKLTTMFPLAIGDDLDLVVKYQATNVSDTAQTYQDNIALIKALVAKYPEIREAFAAVVVRAVEPSGRDYGSLLAMKDIK